MTEMCVFCLYTETAAFWTGGKRYHRCNNCNGIFLDRDFLPSAEAERKRYEKHQNSPDDTGFRSYLGAFIDPVLEAAGKVHTVFDYGSGPEPVLVSLLSERGYDARGWDPFFAPDTRCFPGGADLVVCHEAAEHFFEPRKDFSLMAACVKPAGFLAVGTMTLPDTGVGTGMTPVRDFFETWWYRQDSTHVSFYTEKALTLVAESAGLEMAGKAGKNCLLFRKPS